MQLTSSIKDNLLKLVPYTSVIITVFIIFTTIMMIAAQYNCFGVLTSVVFNMTPIISSGLLCMFLWIGLISDINNKIFDSIYPTLMVAQGTFYTFLGVCFVLFNYSSLNETNNILALLGGLKLAFVSSVIGLFFSIIAKMYIRNKLTIHKAQSIHNVYYDENDIYNVLSTIAEKLQANNQLASKQNELLLKQNNEICHAITKSNEQATINLNKLLTEFDRSLTRHIKITFNNIEKNTETLNNNLEETKNRLLIINNTLNNINHAMNNTTKNMIENITLLNKQTENTINNFNVNLNSTMQEKNKQIANTLNVFNTHLSSTMQDTTNFINKTVTDNAHEIICSFEYLNNITNSTLSNYKKLHDNLQLELQQISEFITNENLDALKNILTNIQYINKATNDYKSSISKSKKSTKNINNANKTSIINADTDINNKRKAIIQEFQTLCTTLTQQSDELNKNLEKAKNDSQNKQKNLTQELNNIILSIVDIIGDLVKKLKKTI